MEKSSLEASPPPCSNCGGTGWVKGNSTVIHCPLCHTTPQRDWFAGLAVLPGNAAAIQAARDFATSPSGWLVLVGGVGTGKSRLLNGIVSQWRGESRYAMTSAELLDVWRSALEEDNLMRMFHGLATAPVAVLDDLGAEKATEWGVERLTMYLDYRYGRALPTAIATNYGRTELAQRLGERLADRVFDQGTGLVRIVALAVPSFRQAVSP